MSRKNKITRREALKGAVALGIGAGLGGCAEHAELSSRTKGSRSRNPVEAENQRTGTKDWLLTNTRINPKTKYRCPWIEGYCSRTSVRAGDELSLHVSTNPASSFNIELYRMGYYGGTG